MKLLATCVSAIIAASTAYALDDGTVEQQSEGKPFIFETACKGLGGLAETTMAERQKNVPMSEMIKRIKSIHSSGILGDVPFNEETLVSMVIAAYQQPRFSAPEVQKESIADFRNGIELLCYTGKM